MGSPFLLAQESATSAGSSANSEDMQTGDNYQNWFDSGGFFTSSRGADEILFCDSSSSGTPFDNSPDRILEIFPTSPLRSSGLDDSTSSGSMPWRGLSLSPPQPIDEQLGSESDRAPSLLLGNDENMISSSPTVVEFVESEGADIIEGQQGQSADYRRDIPYLVQGAVQGMAISPAEYVTMDSYLAELEAAAQAYQNSGDYQYVAPYAWDFYEEADFYARGEQQFELADEWPGMRWERSEESPEEAHSINCESNNQELVDNDEGLYYNGEEQLESSELWAGVEFEGSTVASTTSSMSEVEASQVDRGIIQLAVMLEEIPIGELDDPPDGAVGRSASMGDEDEVD